jgi:hypothetical protein
MKEENCTEQYKGIISLRKARTNDVDIWFGTVGNQLVSDGAFGTKEELINNLENLTLEKVCKMIAGAFGRAVELSKVKEQ